MNPDAALPSFRLDRGTSLAQAQPTDSAPVTLASPALAVMTDLTQVKAATTHPRTTLAQAEQAMIYQGVRMLFVVREMPLIEGLITATDLAGFDPAFLQHSTLLEVNQGEVTTLPSTTTTPQPATEDPKPRKPRSPRVKREDPEEHQS